MTEYSLSTLKDIYNKVPTDKMEACMLELAVLMIQAANLRDLVGAIDEDIHKKQTFTVPFPESITWNDDENGDICVRVMGADKELLSLHSKMKKRRRGRHEEATKGNPAVRQIDGVRVGAGRARGEGNRSE